MADAAGEVVRTIAVYRAAIDGLFREIAGEPSTVQRAEATYRAGASSSGQAAKSVAAVSANLAESWQGTASSAYAGSSRDLTGRLDHVQSTLNRQAETMSQVAQAQYQARSGVESARRGLDAAEKSLLAAIRDLSPAAAPQLVRQAQQAGVQYHTAAMTERDRLADVLRQAAANLNQAAASPVAPVVRRPQTRPAPALTDFQTMYDWLYGCIVDREVRRDKNGRPILVESGYKTVAGPRASMATPNQTTMLNAVGVLKAHPELRSLATPPITQAELDAAEKRMDRVRQVWEAATEAARKDRAEQRAIELRDSVKKELDAAEAAAKASNGTAAANAKVAELQTLLQQREASVAKAAAAAARANAAAQQFAARPERIINARNTAGTGLSDADLKNMLLTGYRARADYGRLTAVERAHMQTLERDLGNDIRVTADTYPSKGKRIAGTLSTFKEQPGEDRAAWQRKAVDDLDLGNGSVGRRINQIALHGPEHRVLTDAFLRDELTRIRRNAKTDEEVARKMAKANNGSGASADYINNVLSCYRRKKAAAAKAAAPTQ
jgi:hypothetical protein